MRAAKMELNLTTKDKKRIEQSIRQKYTKVAAKPDGLFQYPIGLAGLTALNYDSELMGTLPKPVAASYCGVGNPFALGPIWEGEAVLDIGSGAGVDAILAGIMVGTEGKVAGIEMVPEMLARAKENLQMTDLKNVTFVEGSAEIIPFPDASFDLVISNGVFNLIVDKAKALEEALRVLKPNGRFYIADQILAGQLPSDKKARVKSWFQ
jgi:SAM-dependent methyltransferase